MDREPNAARLDRRTPVPNPLRRFLRVSVRGLIVVVLVIGAWLGWVVHQAHVQRDAVAAIRYTGGSVHYDWQWSNGRSTPQGKPWAPQGLVDLIGVDYFGHITGVAFGPSATDATFAQVGRLTRVEILSGISGISSSVSDAGLVHLDGLTKLSVLGLCGTQVTDAGLAHLKGFTQLSRLDLSTTHVSDAGMAHLKDLANLTGLDLRGTKVADAGLVHLKGLTNLSVLVLNSTQVSDTGVNELKQALPRLNITR
jgi:hypothetical protein